MSSEKVERVLRAVPCVLVTVCLNRLVVAQADLQVAEDKATQAVRAKEELQHEKERLSRANGQLAGELGVFRMKIGTRYRGCLTLCGTNDVLPVELTRA